MSGCSSRSICTALAAALTEVILHPSKGKLTLIGCRRSKYTEEEIGLVDEATFMKEAAPQFLEGIDDPHQLQMQRLNYEKYQRQELVCILPPSLLSCGATTWPKIAQL